MNLKKLPYPQPNCVGTLLIFIVMDGRGQKQDGVDIWGYDGKRHIGVQCKNTTGELGLAVVETEIANAEKFMPKLDHLYIVTTAQEMRNFKNQ